MKFKFLVLPLTAAFATTFQKYIFGDVEYLKWLAIVVLLDLITGVTKAWALARGQDDAPAYKAINSKGLRQTVVKIVQYGALLIVTHVLANFTVQGQSLISFASVDTWTYNFLMLIEVKSVYENLVAINPRLDFVQKILNKINALIKTDPK